MACQNVWHGLATMAAQLSRAEARRGGSEAKLTQNPKYAAGDIFLALTVIAVLSRVDSYISVWWWSTLVLRSQTHLTTTTMMLLLLWFPLNALDTRNGCHIN
ncbi:hypothetical protein ACLKA6_002183 [Drosophila palustris]